jgi:hypothetical protein
VVDPEIRYAFRPPMPPSALGYVLHLDLKLIHDVHGVRVFIGLSTTPQRNNASSHEDNCAIRVSLCDIHHPDLQAPYSFGQN